MDVVKLAQNILGNLSPYNYNTPVLGQIRGINRAIFGKQDYSPMAIGMALGVHGAPATPTSTAYDIHLPGRILTKVNPDDTVNWTRYLQQNKIPHLIQQTENGISQFTKDALGRFTGSVKQ